MTDPEVRYAVLGSGSSANAYIFEYNGFSFLIDNGFSCKEVLRRAEKLGFDPGLIKYVFLTHTHSDHMKGIEVLSRKLMIPVVKHQKLDMTAYCRGAIHGQIDVVPGEKLKLGPLTVHSFDTSHDAPHSISYAFAIGESRFCLITDTGVITREMFNFAVNSDTLFLESNYCPRMLREGPYPGYLKDRIFSEYGHLSNRDAVEFLNHIARTKNSRLSKVYFCHLSGTNNEPEVLERELNENLKWNGIYEVCPKGTLVMGGCSDSRV